MIEDKGNIISNVTVSNINSKKKRRLTIITKDAIKIINDTNNNNKDNCDEYDENLVLVLDEGEEIEEKVRYLGNFFTCRGSFNCMINIVYNRNMANLVNIIIIAKEYNMNSMAIWRAGRGLIQSTIEFGLKFYTSETQSKFKGIFGIINKLARFALGAKQSTPLRYLMVILNYDDMALILRKRIIEYDEQSIVHHQHH